jgi:hypothetical protein
VEKLSEEVSSLKQQVDAEKSAKQERERELNNKIKTVEDALQKEREKVIQAENSIVELRKRHREDLENTYIRI